MSALGDAIVYYSKLMADDNTNIYKPTPYDNLGPHHWDCATYNSRCIYYAMGWNNWPDRGYFWPNYSEGGDNWLIQNGFTKRAFEYDLLVEGTIVINKPDASGTYHSWCYAGNNRLYDCNDYFRKYAGGTYADDIAERSVYIYGLNRAMWMYLPPDVPVPPLPRQRQYDRRRQRQRRGF